MTVRTRSALVLVAAALLPLAGCSSDDPDTDTAAAEGPAATSSSSSAPASEETEPPAGETAATDPPRPATTDVVLTQAEWDPAEAALLGSGYISPVVEDGGTCTLEVSRDGNVVRATTEGIADATTTVCDGLALPGDELRSGTWTVVLRYESETTSGESAPVEVEVAP
ncbi:hypothetical protein [Blastococcus sp. URHD0036]|uniref:hypothetical protein n=1 Tax=Blastococcus sp. URHD0036 TaxID=1380356 RepID=UPI000495C96E|nr:hypothetical protein [Blastococcus sp. URHD0036]